MYYNIRVEYSGLLLVYIRIIFFHYNVFRYNYFKYKSRKMSNLNNCFSRQNKNDHKITNEKMFCVRLHRARSVVSGGSLQDISELSID